MYNGEAETLNYRIRLHAPFASAFVIAESDVTFSGKPRQTTSLAARRELQKHLTPAAEMHFLSVPLAGIQGTQPGVFWRRESETRIFLLRWLRRHYPSHRIYVSDVDEFLDAAATLTNRLMFHSDCITPMLRYYYYGEHCPRKSKWAQGVIFRSNSSFYAMAVHRNAQLRATDPWTRARCPVSDVWMGWHFSYALGTAAILHKLVSFSHARDAVVRALLAGNASRNATALIEDRVSRCQDLFGRAGRADEVRLSGAFDGHVPQLPGWPRHPRAP
jgi:hypothetical protein